MPAAFAAATHWCASRSVGLNSLGSSCPSPHSRSVKVFMLKWTNAEISSRCQAIWRGAGRTATALATTVPGESWGERQMFCENANAEERPSDRIITSTDLLVDTFIGSFLNKQRETFWTLRIGCDH